ncbi:hypothetical protein L9F63_018618, partial [Diploptera punctata]
KENYVFLICGTGLIADCKSGYTTIFPVVKTPIRIDSFGRRYISMFIKSTPDGKVINEDSIENPFPLKKKHEINSKFLPIDNILQLQFEILQRSLLVRISLCQPLVLELVSLLSFDKMRRQLTLEQRIYIDNPRSAFSIRAMKELFFMYWHFLFSLNHSVKLFLSIMIYVTN